MKALVLAFLAGAWIWLKLLAGSVFALHLVLTAPARLPWPFSACPPLEWSYEWLRSALQSYFTKSTMPPGQKETEP